MAAIVATATWDRGRIYPNVFIADAKVGGLDRAAALRALGEAPIPRPDSRVVVRAADGKHEWALRYVGVSFSTNQAVDRAWSVGRTGGPGRRVVDRLTCYWRRADIAVPFTVDRRYAAAFIAACARRFDRKPENARIEVEGDRVSIALGKPGVTLERERASKALEGWARSGGRGDLRLPVTVAGPAVTADDLKAIDTVLSSVRTSLAGSSRNRRHNVALAAAAVNGLILPPGATFSYNAVVGPRTEQTGYRTAPVMRAGKLVPGTGGGACQLSSTLYHAALLAGMEIVARSHHSRPVRYTPAGLDATVVYGAIDLKFRNATRYPIALRAEVKGGRLRCQVLGHGPASKIDLIRQAKWLAPPAPQITDDPAMPAGQQVVEVEAKRGIHVRVLRRIGEAEPVRVSNDYYPGEAAAIRQGTGQAPPAAAPIVETGPLPGAAATAAPPPPAPRAPAPGPRDAAAGDTPALPTKEKAATPG